MSKFDDEIAFLRRDGGHKDHAVYSVWIGAAHYGEVYKSERTWERRTPGLRYVNNRGTTTCWRIRNVDGQTFDTRLAAGKALIERATKR